MMFLLQAITGLNLILMAAITVEVVRCLVIRRRISKAQAILAQAQRDVRVAAFKYREAFNRRARREAAYAAHAAQEDREMAESAAFHAAECGAFEASPWDLRFPPMVAARTWLADIN